MNYFAQKGSVNFKNFANSQDDKQVAKDGKVFVICANWKLKIHLLSHRK